MGQDMGQQVSGLVNGVGPCSRFIDGSNGRSNSNGSFKYEQIQTYDRHSGQARGEKFSARDARVGIRDMDVGETELDDGGEETELTEPPELQGPEFDIPEDAYGAAILAICEY